MSSFNTEAVPSVRHWTNILFSFSTTRDPAFRFASGQFKMIAQQRAGPRTSRLQHLKQGDRILAGRKPTGTPVHDALLPGARREPSANAGRITGAFASGRRRAILSGPGSAQPMTVSCFAAAGHARRHDPEARCPGP